METKEISDRPSLKVTLKISSSPPRENSDIEGGRVVLTTLFNLRKHWVIYIGDNVYWWKKHS